MVSETTGMSLFFANYSFNPRIRVEPASPYPPELTAALRKEFFKGIEIFNRFKVIMDKLMAYLRQSQDRYEENANRRRADASQYHMGDLVMLHTGNLKTGRPTQQLTL